MFFSRGCIHTLKLSPNVRKQTNEVRKAIILGDSNKIWSLEVKKLEVILAMVSNPKDDIKEEEREDEQIFEMKNLPSSM